MRKKHFVAVYGTLKSGKSNHSLMALIGAEFVGIAKTTKNIRSYAVVDCRIFLKTLAWGTA